MQNANATRTLMPTVLAFLLFSTGLGQLSHAQTTTEWNGGNGNWADATKWTNGVPTLESDVFIDDLPGVQSLVIDANGDVNNLTLDLGDSLEVSQELNVTTTLMNAGTVSGESDASITARILNNSGFVVASNASNFTLNLAVINNANGVIIANDDSALEITNDGIRISLSDGSLQTNGSGQISMDYVWANDVEFDGDFFYNELAIRGNTINRGVIRNINLGSEFGFLGDVTLSGGGEIQMNNGQGGGTFGRDILIVDNKLSGDGWISAFDSLIFESEALIAPGFADTTNVNDQLGVMYFSVPQATPVVNCPIELDILNKPTDDSEVTAYISNQDRVHAFAPMVLNGPIRVNFLSSLRPVAGDFFDLVVGFDLMTGPDFEIVGPEGYEFSYSIFRGSFANFSDQYDTIRAVVTQSPTVDEAPNAFIVNRGIVTGGSIKELAENDAADWSLQRRVSDVVATIDVELMATTEIQNPANLVFQLDASVFARTNVDFEIYVFNYQTLSYESRGIRLANRFGDSTTEIGLIPPADYIDPTTGELKSKIQYRSRNPRQKFAANIDQVVWKVSE